MRLLRVHTIWLWGGNRSLNHLLASKIHATQFQKKVWIQYKGPRATLKWVKLMSPQVWRILEFRSCGSGSKKSGCLNTSYINMGNIRERKGVLAFPYSEYNSNTLPHCILVPSLPWDLKKCCHKILVYHIQNNRTEHMNWAKKTEI